MAVKWAHGETCKVKSLQGSPFRLIIHGSIDIYTSPDNKVKGGPDTIDKVFLLCSQDIANYCEYNEEKLDLEYDVFITRGTAYAHREYLHVYNSDAGEVALWWLRNRDESNTYTEGISSVTHSCKMIEKDIGVRPVIRISK